MDRDTILSRLRADAIRIRGFGVRSLYLFGSVARGDARNTSDVDLFVDDDDRLDLFRLVGLQDHLRALLGRPVDLGTRNGLHPLLRQSIEGEALRVF